MAASLDPIVALAKAVGIPVATVMVAAGVVTVHGWRLEAKSEALAQAAVKQEVEPVRAQVQAQAGELSTMRVRLENVDSGVRAEVRDVKAEVTQLRISLDKARDEQRVRDELLLREVKKNGR